MSGTGAKNAAWYKQQPGWICLTANCIRTECRTSNARPYDPNGKRPVGAANGRPHPVPALRSGAHRCATEPAEKRRSAGHRERMGQCVNCYTVMVTSGDPGSGYPIGSYAMMPCSYEISRYGTIVVVSSNSEIHYTSSSSLEGYRFRYYAY